MGTLCEISLNIPGLLSEGQCPWNTIRGLTVIEKQLLVKIF
jgi:hypothetical protein